MPRDNRHLWRPLAVWLGVTLATTSAVGALPAAWRAARFGAGAEGVVDVLVGGCAAALALALAWLWVVTTATVAGLVTGQVHVRAGATRRLVLAACGVAVVVGAAGPVAASAGDGRELLVGLPLPERAVQPVRPHDAGRAAAAGREDASLDRAYVVQPGDSLWSIARAHPGDGASVDARWRAIWRANRDVVGDDPDLILPGQALSLPDTHTDPDTTPPPTTTTRTEHDDEHPRQR